MEITPIKDNDLIKEVRYYICPYCNRQHDTYDEAIKCLETHNIVFGVTHTKCYSGYDCWGNYDPTYKEVDSGKIYKSYIKALEQNGTIKIKELN